MTNSSTNDSVSNGIGVFSISSINVRFGGQLLINNLDELIEMQVVSAFIELKYKAFLKIKRNLEFTVGSFDLESLSFLDISGAGLLT